MLSIDISVKVIFLISHVYYLSSFYSKQKVVIQKYLLTFEIIVLVYS